MTEPVKRKCQWCGADLILAVRPSGSKVLLDPDHDPNGRVRVVDGEARRVKSTMSLLDPTDDGMRYHPHRNTCPAWGVVTT